MFNIVNPAIQVVLFCIAIGQPPKHLSISVYNGDHPEVSTASTPPLASGATNYSSLFLSQVDPEGIDFTFYPTLESAIESVRRSAAWAAIEIPPLYSYYLQKRIETIFDPDEETLNRSTIHVHADMTEYPIQVQLQKEMMDAMIKFAKEIVNLTDLLPGGFDSSKLLLPLVQSIDPPVYGHFDPDFREFTTPGFILGIIFVVAVGLTAVSFVQERKDGILERSLVAGVRSIHILLAHVLIQFGIIFFQGLFLFLVIFQLFQISIDGSTILAYFLLILQGAAGMSLGEPLVHLLCLLSHPFPITLPLCTISCSRSSFCWRSFLLFTFLCLLYQFHLRSPFSSFCDLFSLFSLTSHIALRHAGMYVSLPVVTQSGCQTQRVTLQSGKDTLRRVFFLSAPVVLMMHLHAASPALLARWMSGLPFRLSLSFEQAWRFWSLFSFRFREQGTVTSE